LRKDIEKQEDFLSELRGFEEKLRDGPPISTLNRT